MNREQAETLLAKLLFDELDDATRDELSAYLETDPELREQLGDMRLTVNLLREAVADESPTLSDDKHKALLKQVAASPRKRRRDKREVVYRIRPLLAAAAVLMIGVGLAALVLPTLSTAREYAESDSVGYLSERFERRDSNGDDATGGATTWHSVDGYVGVDTYDYDEAIDAPADVAKGLAANEANSLHALGLTKNRESLSREVEVNADETFSAGGTAVYHRFDARGTKAEAEATRPGEVAANFADGGVLLDYAGVTPRPQATPESAVKGDDFGEARTWSGEWAVGRSDTVNVSKRGADSLAIRVDDSLAGNGTVVAAGDELKVLEDGRRASGTWAYGNWKQPAPERAAEQRSQADVSGQGVIAGGTVTTNGHAVAIEGAEAQFEHAGDGARRSRGRYFGDGETRYGSGNEAVAGGGVGGVASGDAAGQAKAAEDYIATLRQPIAPTGTRSLKWNEQPAPVTGPVAGKPIDAVAGGTVDLGLQGFEEVELADAEKNAALGALRTYTVSASNNAGAVDRDRDGLRGEDPRNGRDDDDDGDGRVDEDVPIGSLFASGVTDQLGEARARRKREVRADIEALQREKDEIQSLFRAGHQAEVVKKIDQRIAQLQSESASHAAIGPDKDAAHYAQSKKVDELLNRARDLSQEQKYESALEELEKARYLDPDNAPAQFMQDTIKEQVVRERLVESNRLRLQPGAAGVRIVEELGDTVVVTSPEPIVATNATAFDPSIRTVTRSKAPESGAIAVEELITSPADWPDLTLRRHGGRAGGSRENADELYDERLVVLGELVETKEAEAAASGEQGVPVLSKKPTLGVMFRDAPEFDLSSVTTDAKFTGEASELGDAGVERKLTELRDEPTKRLMDLVRESVDPENWRSNGGLTSSMNETNGALIVTTTSENHQQINALLNQVRLQRSGYTLPPDDALKPSKADRETKQKLGRPVTVNFQGTPLKDAVAELRKKTDSSIFVHWESLEAYGVKEETPITMRFDRISADKALQVVLDEVGGAGVELGYTMDDGVVIVARDEDLATKVSIAAHDIRDLLTGEPNEPQRSANAANAYRRWASVAVKGMESGDLDEAEQGLDEAGKLLVSSRVHMDVDTWDKLRGIQRSLEADLAESQATKRQLQQQVAVMQRQAEARARAEKAAPVEEPIVEQGKLPPASNFKQYPVNRWVMAEHDNLSTFALDTDTASYRLVSRYIRGGYLPPHGAVRMEEVVNAFDYNYPTAGDQAFAVHVDAAPAPFAKRGADTVLLKIGVQGRVVGREGRKPAHLVFVVDASGSMNQADRLPLAQFAMTNFNGNLTAGDNVSLVTYSSEAQVQLENASLKNLPAINDRINRVQTSGSTNTIDGLKTGYQIAARHYDPNRTNCVVLFSDGMANIGETDARAMLSKVDDYRRQGITLTAAGVGLGGYNDELLEQLANNGDGNYLFLDSAAEARKQFVDRMDANLQTIAKDAKIQVEFNRERVRRYRLIGYENRDIADKDFRNDAVDAGEVGSGQSATALYEVELIGPWRHATGLPPIGTVHVRYRDTQTERVCEIASSIRNDHVKQTPVSQRPRFYLAAAAAQFAELMRGSLYADGGNLDDVLRVVNEVSAALPLDTDIKELRDLVGEARNLRRAP